MLAGRVKIPFCTVAMAFLLVSIASGGLRAATVTFLCAKALQPAMTELIPQFEELSGDSVKISYANIGANAARVRRGQQADVVVISPPQWDALNREGRIAPDVRAAIGRISIGLFVGKGAARPNIESAGALKKTLLGAKAIAVHDPGASRVGARTIAIFDQLGLRDQIMSKVVFTAKRPFDAVISGKAELGFSTTVEIAAATEVDLVGPLPAELQAFTTFIVAMSKEAKDLKAGKDLIAFLTSAHAATLLESKGIESSRSH